MAPAERSRSRLALRLLRGAARPGYVPAATGVPAMIERFLTALSVLTVGAALLGGPSSASAQCRPDDIFCAELRIGPAQQPPPPPPPVVVAPPPPQPPVVIVQQAPPPPPPRVIYVQPAPPPPPPRVVVRERVEIVPAFEMGVHLNVAGVFTPDVTMGGFQAAYRLRPSRHFAIDIGGGLFGGESAAYSATGGSTVVGRDRLEMPANVDLLFFFNPQHRFQVYALVGVGMSWAWQGVGDFVQREFFYLGGQAGLGFEIRLGRHFALNLDGRFLLRENLADGDPEFSRRVRDGIQSTNTSAGFYATAGMTFYFGGRN